MAFLQLKKCFSEPKQFIKLMVLIVCVCFTLSQLSECVRKIMHPPVSTYYKFYLNESMRYPSLTVCRKPAYRTDRFEKFGLKPSLALDTSKAFNTFRFDQYSVEEFLDEATYNFRSTVGSYAFSEAANKPDVNISNTYIFPYGRCHTLQATSTSYQFSVSGGYWLYLFHDSSNKARDYSSVSLSGFHIFLHDSNEVLSGAEGQADSFLEYLYVESAEHIQVVLKVQRYSQISTSDDPCNSDPTYSKSKCIEECVHQQVAESVGCTLPWLRVPKDVQFPQCSNSTSVKNLITAADSKSNKYKKFMVNCHCEISCNISVYSTQIMNKRDSETNDSIVSIYYSSNVVTQMNEVISYDWNIFLSDIGGSLGFLLGLSVIGVIAVLEEIFQIMLRLIFSKKTKKQKEEVDDVAKEPNSLKDVINNKEIFEFYEKTSNEKNSCNNENNKY